MNERSETEARSGANPKPLHAYLAATGFSVLWIILQVALAVIFKFQQVDVHSGVIILICTGLFTLAVWKYLLRSDDSIGDSGIRFSIISLPHWIAGIIYGSAGIALALLILRIPGAVAIAGQESITNGEDALVFSWIGAIVIFTVYAGIEEVLFRGLIYPFLRKHAGLIGALVFSSVLFGLFHILNNEFSLIAFVSIMFAGAWMALLREFTGSIWLAWGAHFGWNFAMAATGIQVSGMETYITPRTWSMLLEGPEWLTGGAFGIEGGIAGLIATIVLFISAIGLLRERSSDATDQTHP